LKAAAHSAFTPAATLSEGDVVADTAIGAGRLVLVVDDDRATLLILAQSLRQAGFRVLTASDPLQAFAVSLRERPSVIVSDMQMPAGGGNTLLKRLQGSTRTSGIPVVVVTGSVGPADRERLLSVGVAAVLGKPVEPVELVGAVAAAAQNG
jgi:CheY-like chemotaxis protein